MDGVGPAIFDPQTNFIPPTSRIMDSAKKVPNPMSCLSRFWAKHCLVFLPRVIWFPCLWTYMTSLIANSFMKYAGDLVVQDTTVANTAALVAPQCSMDLKQQKNGTNAVERCSGFTPRATEWGGE